MDNARYSVIMRYSLFINCSSLLLPYYYSCTRVTNGRRRFQMRQTVREFEEAIKIRGTKIQILRGKEEEEINSLRFR